MWFVQRGVFCRDHGSDSTAVDNRCFYVEMPCTARYAYQCSDWGYPGLGKGTATGRYRHRLFPGWCTCVPCGICHQGPAVFGSMVLELNPLKQPSPSLAASTWWEGARECPGLECRQPELLGCHARPTLGDALCAQEVFNTVLDDPDETGLAVLVAWREAVDPYLRPQSPLLLALAPSTCCRSIVQRLQSCWLMCLWAGAERPAC